MTHLLGSWKQNVLIRVKFHWDIDLDSEAGQVKSGVISALKDKSDHDNAGEENKGRIRGVVFKGHCFDTSKQPEVIFKILIFFIISNWPVLLTSGWCYMIPLSKQLLKIWRWIYFLLFNWEKVPSSYNVSRKLRDDRWRRVAHCTKTKQDKQPRKWHNRQRSKEDFNRRKKREKLKRLKIKNSSFFFFFFLDLSSSDKMLCKAKSCSL